MEQLNALLNSETVLLTVQRGNQKFISRQPRILLSELNPSTPTKNEYLDWYFEGKFEGGVQSLYTLPYVLNTNGVVEKKIPFIDSDVKQRFFPLYPVNETLEAELKNGDKILSVGGVAVSSGLDVLKQVQERRVVMITKQGQSATLIEPVSQQQKLFIDNFESQDLELLISEVGRGDSTTEGQYKLLAPFSTVPFSTLASSGAMKEQWQSQYESRKEDIQQIQDSEKRDLALKQLEKMHQRQVLGVILQDRRVEYNPGPLTLMGDIVVETLQTLKALFIGSLNPKWLGGPIGIVYIIQQGWRSGIGEALFWMAAISLNLGIFNLLPIPVLDGGYICLSLFEWVTGIRLSARTMERLILPFALLIIGLLIFLTFQDLSRLFGM